MREVFCLRKLKLAIEGKISSAKKLIIAAKNMIFSPKIF